MNSRLLTCRVRHERRSPKPHSFEYPLYAYMFDLDEIDELDRKLRFFGHNRFRLASLHDGDYLSRGEGGLRDKLTEAMAGQGLSMNGADTVYLVTSARFLNYVFNPVSFYWIFRDGEFRGCLAEVNNTFGEKHIYPLPGPGLNGGFPVRYEADKAFHVSPFFDLNGRYEFSFGDVRDRLDVTVRLVREGEQVFEAGLTEEGERLPLTDGALLRNALRRPFTAHLTFPRILWEAGKLYFGKRLGFHAKPEPSSKMTIRHGKSPGLLGDIPRRLVFRTLRRMDHGRLELNLPGGESISFGSGDAEQTVRMDIHDPRFFRRVVLDEDVGLGEMYSEGKWDSPDLVALFLYFLRNGDLHRPRNSAWRRLSGRLSDTAVGTWQRMRHLLAPKNSERGARQNIAAHYDLSNELFSRFLDPSMMYSSGIYPDPDRVDPADTAALSEAQRRKNARLAELACIGEGDHVLEIGCGWGGFAEQAAREYGCRVTGLTLSREQYDFARERIRKAGLEDRVDIRLQDYRRVSGPFDRIVSIEMLEAVGHAYHPQFFETVDRLLAPSGLAAVQVITMQDPHYERYRRGVDWIRKHIFPGGALPSLTRICEVTAARTSLTVQRVDSIGPHYAATLRQWRHAFNANWDAISRFGFDDYFRRTWNYYFSVCEAGFLYGHINNIQFVLGRAEPAATQRAVFRPGG